MSRLVRFTPNRRGIGAIAKSSEVDQMLEGRAERIAAAAQDGYGLLGEDIAVDVVQAGSDTRQRARVAVIARSPRALRLEAKHRVLGGSLDAAR